MKKILWIIFFVLAGFTAFLFTPISSVSHLSKFKTDQIAEFKILFIADSMRPYDRLVYEPLIEKVGDVIKPVLASDYKVGAKDYIFTVRKGILFSTGKEMAATDVVFSYTYAKSANTLPKTLTSHVTSVSADGSSVKFAVSAVSDEVLESLSSLLIISEDAKSQDDQLIGTGAYTVSGENLTARTDYWGPKPLVTKFIVGLAKSNTWEASITSLKGGQLMGIVVDKSTLNEPQLSAASGLIEKKTNYGNISLYMAEEKFVIDDESDWQLSDVGERVDYKEQFTFTTPRWEYYGEKFDIID